MGLVWLCIAVMAMQGLTVNGQPGLGSRFDDMDCPVMDFVFVLDSSGSIGTNNWQKVLNFTKTFVDALETGEDGMRYGVVIYGASGYIQFHLNDFYDKRELLQAIDLIPWKDESTNTSGGIRLMRRDMFKPERGDRPLAPNVAIVMTDGESTVDANLTIPEANRARDEGIFMFALGVGNQTKKSELEGIGNSPTSDFVFMVTDFSALNAIQEKLREATCRVRTDCRRKNDIAFVLDASGSVNEGNFGKVRDMLVDMVGPLGVGLDMSRVAVTTFSTDARVEFHLDTYQNSGEMRDAIRQIRYTAGTTNTAAALRQLRTEVFREDRGDRPEYGNVAVLFTDGGSNDIKATLEQALEAKAAGITLLVVAVSDWVNRYEVNAIASEPDSSNVFQVEDFDSLASISARLKSGICDNLDECSSNPCKSGATCINGVNRYQCICPAGLAGINCEHPCRKPADLAFALDSSTSVGDRGHYETLQFVKGLVQRLNLNSGRVRVASETFANRASMRFQLDRYNKMSDVMEAFGFDYTGGTTNTAAGLRMLRETIFQTDHGDRRDARNIAIVITDGQSTSPVETFAEAVAARAAGIDLLTIGVNMGYLFAQRELKGIASDPDDQHMFNINSFENMNEDLEALSVNFIDTICDNTNECNSLPCQAGGECVDGLDTYRCECPRGRTGRNCERACDGQTDVIFMIDASGSIRENRFRLVLGVISDIVDELEIGTNRTRVGAIVFSDEAQVVFHLDAYRNKEDVKHAIASIPFLRGKTNLADPINTMRGMFTTEHGGRDTAPNFAVLVTDGHATVDPEMTLPAAISARVEGIHMIVVTAENDANSLELKGIASDPDEKNIFAVERFSLLPGVVGGVVMGMCDDMNECDSSPCQNGGKCVNALKQYLCLCSGQFTGRNCERRCTRRADVVLVLDSSGSTEANFDMAQKLTKEIVQGLNFEGQRVRVGVVTFSDEAKVEFYLNTYTEKLEILNAIAFLKGTGRTNTAASMVMTRTDLFTAAAGDRGGDPNYVIVITDGFSNIQATNTIPEVDTLKNNGANVIAVGLGSKVNRGELEAMSSDPDKQYTFYLPSGEVRSIANAANNVLDTICEA